jgi:hypothetical protein
VVGLTVAACKAATDVSPAQREAIVESMKSDLVRLVPAMEAFYCGIFIGPTWTAPNPFVTEAEVPACW